jgi:hypothetical protein
MKLIKTVEHLWVAKGKKVIYFDLKESVPKKSELEPHIMGRSGNLRAPSFIRGKKMFVGFSQEGYEDFFS